MISTSYEYYRDEYKGLLSETDFDKYYKKAVYKLNDLTDGKYKNASEQYAPEDMIIDVRELTCNVVDRLSAVDNANAEVGGNISGIKSIKVGSISKTFTTGSDSGSSVSATSSGALRNLVQEYCGQYGWGCRWV